MNWNATSSDIQDTIPRNGLPRNWNSNKSNRTIQLWNLSEGQIMKKQQEYVARVEHLIWPSGKWFCMAMLERWASMQCFLCFQIKLLVFCMNTMIHCTPLWACLLSLWTGVVSVFTASFDQIRCTCTIYASHAKYVWYANICNNMHIMHILHML